ncbi:FUSC family protein [Paenibacillus segetis]|nr:FUSC family protein [Paenibacillus segetis]
MDIGIKKIQATLLLAISFPIIGVLSYLSGMNPVLGLIIHLVSIFLIMMLFSEKLETKAFLPFMLCYVFAQGNPVIYSEIKVRIFGLLAGGILIAIIYYLKHRKSDDSNAMNLQSIFRQLSKSPLRVEYAIKMAVGVSIGMLIGDLSHAQKGMWISLTIFSIMQPHFTHSKERVKHRLMGNLIGAAVFVVLFIMLPPQYSMLVTLALSYIYMFVVEYRIQMIFVTINALSAALVLFDYSVSIPMRISFIILGACIGIGISLINLKGLFARRGNASS